MQPVSPSPGAAGSFEKEYPYGWRYVKRLLPDGGETWDQVPLTLEDVLHPQEGDVIPENTIHESDCRYLADVFMTRPLTPPHTLVTRDLLVNWGVEGVRNHSPDIGVFVGLKHEPPEQIGILPFAELDGRCELLIEVVSPNTRSNDVVEKYRHYHQVGVPLYVLIDQEQEDGPRTLRAYRRTPAEYVPVPLNEQGQLPLSLLRLRLGLRDNRVVCFDSVTGKELGDYARIVRALEEADRRAEQQNQAIEEQVLARQEAERRANDQRQETDRQRRAREQAESKLEESERSAREQAEKAAQRIRELEDLLRSLQQGGAGGVEGKV